MDKESIIKYFINFSNMKKKTFDAINYKLKYDYEDQEFLKSILDFSETSVPNTGEVNNREDRSFVECLSHLLSEFDDERALHFFINVCSCTNINEIKDMLMEDSSSRIIKNGNTVSMEMYVPKTEFTSDNLYSVITHEMTHFSMILGNCRDYYEYSEALSIFFEYLMFKTCNEKEGYDNFVYNRLPYLKSNFEDLNDDLFFAMNPQFLGIDESIDTLPLASNLTYPESFEYALNLIDRRNEDKKTVDKEIVKLLYREKTLQDVAATLDFDTKGYAKTLKLLKK